MLAMSRSLSMPEAPFDDLITELRGAVEEDHPLSAGLDTLDMQLPSMELTPDMQGEPDVLTSSCTFSGLTWPTLPDYWRTGMRAESISTAYHAKCGTLHACKLAKKGVGVLLGLLLSFRVCSTCRSRFATE